MAARRPPKLQPASIKDWMSVLIFDGRGGVRKLDEAEELDHTVPARGFSVVAGSIAAPDFIAWLKADIGEFNAGLLTVPNTRTRCTVLEDKAMVVMRATRPGAEPEDVARQLLSLYIEKGRVIIASELNMVDLLGVAQWQVTHHAPLSPADLVARLALRASDRMEPLVERMGDSLDDVEEELLTGKRANIGMKLARLRRTLISLRRLVWPQRDVLNTLEIEELSFLSARDRVRLREAAGRTARLGDELQALSERAVLVHEQILDTRAEMMNKTMLVLAAATVVFMPLTLISGALGMNVSGIPFHDSPYAFWVVCGLLVTLGLGIAIWMKKRKWL